MVRDRLHENEELLDRRLARPCVPYDMDQRPNGYFRSVTQSRARKLPCEMLMLPTALNKTQQSVRFDQPMVSLYLRQNFPSGKYRSWLLTHDCNGLRVAHCFREIICQTNDLSIVHPQHVTTRVYSILAELLSFLFSCTRNHGWSNNTIRASRETITTRLTAHFASSSKVRINFGWLDW